MTSNPLKELLSFGQSVWYDNIHREMINNGELQKLITDDGIKGVTSNPTIFQKAFSKGESYRTALQQRLEKNPSLSSKDLFFDVAMEDVKQAAELFLPVYQESNGTDGFVSIEVAPDLAHDEVATVEEARSLYSKLNMPNIMIKVPATKKGIPAIESLIADGISVNATLLFSVQRYEEVMQAFLSGLQKRKAQNKPIDKVASVASFFISRVDSKIDSLLQDKISIYPELKEKIELLQGKIAIANAKKANQSFKTFFSSKAFTNLKNDGAQIQRLLWASTGTKNKEFSDILYIESLIGQNTINTMPPSTLDAFRDHGKVSNSLEENADTAIADLESLQQFKINIDEVTDQLEKEGVKSFVDSYVDLLNTVDQVKQELLTTS